MLNHHAVKFCVGGIIGRLGTDLVLGPAQVPTPLTDMATIGCCLGLIYGLALCCAVIRREERSGPPQILTRRSFDFWLYLGSWNAAPSRRAH